MEERLKMFLRPGQILDKPGLFLLSPFPLGDIEKRRPPMGSMPWLLVHRDALEITRRQLASAAFNPTRSRGSVVDIAG